MPSFIRDEPLSSWSQFADAMSADVYGRRWYFRGTLVEWGLESSLERALRDWGISLERAADVEKATLRDFRRAFRSFGERVGPSHHDTLGWLALMQHHGAPTRLMDWSYSPFVAAYFALDSLLGARNADTAVVWAIAQEPFDDPTPLLPKSLWDVMKDFRSNRCGESFDAIFRRPADDSGMFVFPVNPYFLHERLKLQQGVFLCPGNVGVPFLDNLRETTRSLGSLEVVRYLIPRKIMGQFMGHLKRMNMTRTTLFPGLDGYSQSFRAETHFYAQGVVYPDTEL